MIPLTGRRFCTVWNYRETLEEVITEPKDQETIHICNGPHNSYCRKAVYKDLPYIKTLGDDAKVCRRCVYALSEQLKAERRNQRGECDENVHVRRGCGDPEDRSSNSE